MRDGAQAIRDANQAVNLHDSPAYRNTLAAAYAEAGQYENAVREQETAISMLKAVTRSQTT